jgi:hypothetical protein
MSLWRRTRNEVAGACRSLRYDLDRRVPDRPVADVTSTGMSTFGGPVAEELSIGYDEELPRRPRRLVAASVFGLLAIAGAAGSYFAVVSGLGTLLSEKPAAAEAHPYPLAAEAPPTASNAGLGRGDTLPEQQKLAATGPSAAVPPATDPVRAAATARTRVATPERTGATMPACDCPAPPVPTPTAPSISPSPTASSPSPSPSASESPDTSASPSPSAGSSSEAFRRRRQTRGY